MKRIHINQHVIRRNGKTGQRRPTITIKEGSKNTYAQGVKILGPSEVIYSPDKPLPCGAKVWLETNAELELTGAEVVGESAFN